MTILLPYNYGSIAAALSGRAGGGGPSGNGPPGHGGGNNGPGRGNGGNNGNNGGGAQNPTRATAVAILSSMLHYWNLDEADTNLISTNRVDSKAAGGNSWTLSESVVNLASTGVGVRGGSSVAAQTNNGGSSGSMGALVKGSLVASLTATQSFTVAGWVAPIIGTFPLTIFRESLTSATAASLNIWIAIDNAGTAGSPYSLFACVRGSSSGDYSNIARQEVATNDTWMFVQAVRDHANGKVRLRVNDGTWNIANAVNTNDSGAAREVWFGATPNAGNRVDRMTGRFNYWGYYGSILTDAQLDWLYNAGQGRTYAEIQAAAA